jgi:hypothetical protein
VTGVTRKRSCGPLPSRSSRYVYRRNTSAVHAVHELLHAVRLCSCFPSRSVPCPLDDGNQNVYNVQHTHTHCEIFPCRPFDSNSRFDVFFDDMCAKNNQFRQRNEGRKYYLGTTEERSHLHTRLLVHLRLHPSITYLGHYGF